MKYWLCLATLLPALCAAAPAPADTAESTARAIAAAEAALRKADAVGFARRGSQAQLAQARAAEAKHDYATARKLADGARKQGELAYQQYLDQTAAAHR